MSSAARTASQHSQLLVYHFMFGPDYTAGCPSCGRRHHHTYSAYSRGLDALWGMYQWPDRAPRGRNETGVWWRRHDEYESMPQNAGSCCHEAKAA